MPLNPRTTIDQARAWLRERLRDGAECPVCTQRVQLYRRKLNSGMVHALFRIYQHNSTEWTRVQDMPNAPKGGDYAKLRFWGLLEQNPARAEDGNSAGYWRVTADGVSFLMGSMSVPSHIGTFDNKVYPLRPDEYTLITAREALGNKFDYDELLANTPAAVLYE